MIAATRRWWQCACRTQFRGDTLVASAVESMSGFTLVLASLKMWLEHGIEGELTYDKFPDATYADR